MVVLVVIVLLLVLGWLLWCWYWVGYFLVLGYELVYVICFDGVII